MCGTLDPKPSLRFGVDIGGTFTDLCIADSQGVVAVGKLLTTTQEVASGVEALLRATAFSSRRSLTLRMDTSPSSLRTMPTESTFVVPRPLRVSCDCPKTTRSRARCKDPGE